MKRFFNWLRSFFKKEKVISVSSGNSEGYSFAWRNAKYDIYLVEKLKKSKLIHLKPKDQDEFGWHPDPIVFWGRLLVQMSYYESKWDTNARYKESFRDRNGDQIISRGLFQLSIESGRSYDKELIGKYGQVLHDPEVNIGLAIKIMETLISQDGRIAGKIWGKWKGGARYWSVLRGEREYTKQALESIKNANK